METAPPNPKVLTLTGINSPLHPGVAHVHIPFNCTMNLSSWVKSIKQTFCGTVTACMARLHLSGGGGTEGRIESSSDSIAKDSLLGSSSVVKLISESLVSYIRMKSSKESTSHS